ncbi:hypothetical protein BN1095_6890001 [Clostridioides difficile]|uniref:Uncharacterized protein n=1 Tax=Clostridioides difficile TaxID=1496 RepID=A0A069B161_CLODI|nr:hypothetical protein BN1095_6890001 [Clostridioides difficile]
MGIAGAVNVLNPAAGRGTAVVVVGFAVPHAACVGKQAQADGARVFRAGHREEQLGGDVGFFVAAVADFFAVFVIDFSDQVCRFRNLVPNPGRRRRSFQEGISLVLP